MGSYQSSGKENADKIIITQKNIIYSLDNENNLASVIGNVNVNGAIFIPRSIKYKGKEYYITKISKKSFIGSKTIKSIYFPPDSLIQIIERKAFEGSSIESIIIPSQVIRICSCAFDYCEKIHNIWFTSDSKLQTIGGNAFSFSAIENIEIPSKVINLEGGWCYGMRYLEKITINSNNEYFKNYEENDQLIIGKSDQKSDEYDTLVFVDRNLKKVIIPPFIKRIAPYAFSESLIESIEIPFHIIEIGKCSFYMCKNLHQIKIPSNSQINSIGDRAFYMSSIESIFFPQKITQINFKSIFDYCSRLHLMEIDENCKIEKICKDDICFELCNNLIVYVSKNIEMVNPDFDFIFSLNLATCDFSSSSM